MVSAVFNHAASLCHLLTNLYSSIPALDRSDHSLPTL